ncbi:translation initiation factor eIF-1A [Methanofollis aquaemaris]|uniref:Translation initiation factor 1A n=1 Tax=Methanofollis aquaemaris TaxID=126734 RepID=A0A8A3S6N0_9EURY|nr:translation initiation factor eIF-1A [Methanofollis aquaemaris]
MGAGIDLIRGVDSLSNFRNKKKNVSEGEVVRVRLPNKKNKEMFASADLMLGANHIRVRCFDGTTRVGRIKGKIKKRVWIREGDTLIVVPWDFQAEKCDIIYRYTRPQVDWLRGHGYL